MNRPQPGAVTGEPPGTPLRRATKGARSGRSGNSVPSGTGLGREQALLLFCIALALRLAHILAMRESPYFDHPVIDALTYHKAAVSIASEQGHPDRVFWQPPGYSYFLAILYSVAGSPSFLLPRLAQALFGAASAVLTAWIGARHFGTNAGLAAGYVVAAYGTLIYFDGELLGTSLTILLQLGAVALAVLARESKRRPERLWFAAGITAGAASWVTATSLVFAPVFALAARRKALASVAVLLGTALSIAPATIRNATVGGELVPLSTNAGINLYIGNNPEYDRTIGIRPDRVWTEFTKEPFLRGIQTKGGASDYWAAKAFRWMVEDPLSFLALQVKKLRLLLGGDEILRNQSIYPARRHSPLLAVLLWKAPGIAFPFGILGPFAIWGLVVAWKRARLLAAIAVLYALGVLAFFIVARYRVPLVPYLIIFAVQGVVWFRRPAHPKLRLPGGLAVASLLILCNAGQGTMTAEMNADAEFNLGLQLYREGRLDGAQEHYRNALRQRPDYVEAWVNLGVLESMRGRYEEGSRALEEAVRIAPRDPTALISLAALRERQRRWEEAAAIYEQAAAADSTDPYPSRRVAELRRRGLVPAR